MWAVLSRKRWDKEVNSLLNSSMGLVQSQQIQITMGIVAKFEQCFIYSLSNA